MIWPLYYAFLYAMNVGIRISSLWNPKAKQWISGRKDWRKKIIPLTEKHTTRIWFHVSSLGEFEQARPVIEELKQGNPEWEIILTFFSPSGFEIRKNYAHAKVFYLPADLPGNAEHWISIVKPDLAVFVKYDLWPGFLHALIQHKLPFILISAHFIPGTFSSWSIPPTNLLLKKAKAIFLQNDLWIEKLKEKGFHNIHIAGDTRIDRTLMLTQESINQLPKEITALAPFDLIAGSTWKEDEDFLIPVVEKLNLKVILAPHNISESNMNRLLKQINVPAVLFSQWKEKNQDFQILVIDNIGMLAYLYSQGKIAYIGGGFGKGIHNILEPAAHGVPVIFGPKYHAFPEAESMVKSGAAVSIKDQTELENAIHLFSGKDSKMAGEKAFAFLENNKGATQIITSYIRESIPFGSKS